MLSRDEAAEILLKRLHALQELHARAGSMDELDLLLDLMRETQHRLRHVLSADPDTRFAASEIDFDRPIPDV